MKSQNLNGLHHETVQLRVGYIVGYFFPHYFCKLLNILIKWFWWAHIVVRDARFTWRRSGQFTLLKDQCEQWKQWMTVNGIFVTSVDSFGHVVHSVVWHDVICLIMNRWCVVHVAHRPIGLQTWPVMGQAVVVSLSHADDENSTCCWWWWWCCCCCNKQLTNTDDDDRRQLTRW